MSGVRVFDASLTCTVGLAAVSNKLTHYGSGRYNNGDIVAKCENA